MNFNRFLLLLALPFYLLSCKPQQVLPNYLENLSDTTGKGAVKIPELRIQKNDQLFIQVYSGSKKPEASDVFYNLPASQGAGQGAVTSGFLVDVLGNIDYPQLGSIHAEGLTKQELAAEIRKRLTQPVELLADPSVIIRFLNFKVNVLGEVAKPGLINVPGERITILEAIGLAGDITQYGRKNTVKVIREIDGDRNIGTIDLSSKDLFESPYYNLLQNDVVMVEPSKRKAQSAEQALTAQKISFALTIVTVAATLANIFIRN
jgi:polysaccharide export outer membrane protein